MNTTPGRLEVIVGPMFSRKSEELIRRLKRARIAQQRVACFKPDIDLRYHRTAIASHSSQTHDAETVANVERLRASLAGVLDQIEVVGIDEAQFFDDAVVHLAMGTRPSGASASLSQGSTPPSTPSPSDPSRRSWPSRTKSPSSPRSAWSAAPRPFTRSGWASPQELVVVGAAGMYEARCRNCFRPFVDEHGSEQLELGDIQAG